METLIAVPLFLLSCVLQEKLVSTACTGSGFPVQWTNETGVTYWYATPIIKRQFTAGYSVIDYYTTDVSAMGASPSCVDEYYDSTSGYYYYLMYYGDENVYSLDTDIEICHGYKQFDNVIREFYHEFAFTGTITSAHDCVGLFTAGSSSIALSKLNFEFVNCPFKFASYNFTFSDSGNPNYCAGKTSEAYIENEVISLNSCFDPNNVTSGTPYNGQFSCLGSWQAEERDTISFGDFIVIEMYNDAHWPYCGRYKVDENGAITLSIYLSMSQGDWFPVMCIASVDNEFMYDDGNQKFVRMVFTLPSAPKEEDTTQVEPTTATTTPTTVSSNLSTVSSELTTTTLPNTMTATTKPTTASSNLMTESSELTTTLPNMRTATTKLTTVVLNRMTASTEPTIYKPTTSTSESTPFESKTITNMYRTEGVTIVHKNSTTVLTNGSTNISNNAVTLKSAEFPYWWIIVGVLIPLVAFLSGCFIYAAKRGKGKGKVDTHNQEEGTSAR